MEHFGAVEPKIQITIDVSVRDSGSSSYIIYIFIIIIIIIMHLCDVTLHPWVLRREFFPRGIQT